MQYDIKRCTRRCAESGRELQPGEAFFSALTTEGAEVVRHDYATEAWKGPPEGAVGWWKSVMPTPTAKGAQLAPNDVILQLFEQTEDQPQHADMRFVLALLLVRRRVARLEAEEEDEAGRPQLVIYCFRNETTYKTLITQPSPERSEEIQEQLAELLFADEK